MRATVMAASRAYFVGPARLATRNLAVTCSYPLERVKRMEKDRLIDRGVLHNNEGEPFRQYI
jgi:hypothetical protein